jgi:tetratricopeptide (TPR) repeat protein
MANCTVCGQALDAQGRCPRCQAAPPPAAASDEHPNEVGHVWTIQDWRPLLTLWLVIALGFSFTRLVVNGYDEQQQKLAAQYYAAGTRAMEAHHPEQAVEAFEGALVYSHNNFDYQLKLTDALLASGAAGEGEAIAQLHAFLDQRPTDAQVKLKLARVEARRHHVDEALRYYLEAIEGDWPEHTDPFPQRIAVRFESAEYLIEQERRPQAEGALQALAAVLPVSWPEQEKLGDLFLRIGNAPRALKVYQVVLDQDPENQAALLGAAKASLSTSSYGSARRYLLEIKPPTEESRRLLAELDRLEALDPFAPDTSPSVRVQRTLTAFGIANRRMAACAASISGASSQVQERWSKLERWAGQLAPAMNERKLRGRDDLIESTMRFAFQAEMAAEQDCGPASNASVDDRALLLLARERMGAVQ